LPILGLSLVLLITACKKEDFQETEANATASGTPALNDVDTVGWKSTAQWETADQETFSVHYFTINDAGITTDVADNGLVLLYKKNGNAINALPFEETAASGETSESTDENSNANYWYHQVSEGSLLISCDVYSATPAPDAANSFKYFIITPEKLQSLQNDGHTIEELMNLSYTDAAALLSEVK
jgi:hypothetical protein